jgi:hypothetical protein
MICPSCDSVCSYDGARDGLHLYRCEGCGLRWPGPEPVCVDFMEDER